MVGCDFTKQPAAGFRVWMDICIVVVAIPGDGCIVWVAWRAAAVVVGGTVAVAIVVVKARNAINGIWVVVVPVAVVIVIGGTGFPRIFVDVRPAIVAIAGVDGRVGFSIATHTDAVGGDAMTVAIFIAVVGDAPDGIHVVEETEKIESGTI